MTRRLISGLVRPREDWVDPAQPIDGPASFAPSNWVIHYPGGGSWFPRNDDEVAAYLRSLQKDYLDNRGYSLGYNWGVAQHGTGWEIRGDEYRAASNPGRKVEGNFNAVSQSIFVMVPGAAPASSHAVRKINEIIATQPTWGVKVHVDVDFTACAGAGIIDQVRRGVIGHQSGVIRPPTTTPPIEGYDPTDEWGLFPLDARKPTVREGDRNEHVTYLNDVLFFYAGGHTLRTDWFDDDTTRAVKLLQGMFGLTVDGIVGPAETWPVIDYIVALNTRPPLPEPPEDDSVQRDVPARYVVQRGDSPWSVGEVVYGSGKRGAQLIPATEFGIYSTPGHLHIIDVPEVVGATTKVLPGEGPYSTARRLGVDLDEFYAWNGGDDRTFHPGERVWASTSGS